MGKETVRVVAFPEIPYVYPCFVNYPTNVKNELKCRQPGVEIVLIYDQLISLGFKPTFINADNETYMKHMLDTGLADIAGTTGPLQGADNLSITLPLYQDKMVFMVGQPRSVSVPSLLFYQCDWLLWLTVIVSLAVCLSYKKFHNYALTGRFRTLNRTDFASKFPLIAWGISFVVFSSLYSNNLAITMAQQRTDMPFDSFDQLVKKLDQDQCRFFLSQSQIQYRSSGIIAEIGLSKYATKLLTALNKAVVFDDNDKDVLLSKITEEECNIGLAWETDGAVWQSMNDKVSLIEIQEMPSLTFVYYVNPGFNSKYKNQLSYLNAGSINSLYKSYLEKILEENCRKTALVNTTDSTNGVELQSLKIYQLKETFFILLAGMGISLITLFFSLIKTKLKAQHYGAVFSKSIKTV